MRRGLFRLCVALSLVWLAFAVWLYSTGISRDYNSPGTDWFSEEKFTAEEIARMPRLDEVEKRFADLDWNYMLEWETYWVYYTRGLLPALYDREKSRETCKYILVRNFSNAVLNYRATCRTGMSWPGLVALVAVPIVVLLIVVLLFGWVASGFTRRSSSNAG